MKKRKKIVVIFGFISCILFLSLLSLTGCSSMNSKFDCNTSSGGACLPMDRVNEIASAPGFNGNTFLPQKGQQNQEENSGSDITGYPVAVYEGAPIRYGETVQRIWIAPYEDNNNNYHEAGYVYTVVKGGHWIGDPVQAVVTGDGE